MVFPPFKHVHGFKEEEKRTVFGGFLCIFVKLFMVYIVLYLGQRIFGFGDIVISSQSVTFKDYWDKIALKDTSKILIEVW